MSSPDKMPQLPGMEPAQHQREDFEKITITGRIVPPDLPRAIRFEQATNSGFLPAIWLPRSQIRLAEAINTPNLLISSNDNFKSVTMPRWLAREKGIIK